MWVGAQVPEVLRKSRDLLNAEGRALSLGDDLTAVLTYDRRMLETARAEGLPAHAPGMAD